ncbi:hypothetical protein IFT43_15120 [Oxalobacteraceae sp. CFBP 13708]|nr:hypothetical protein [Oxalobacteraceae sp. CFBP 13708]
MYAQKLTTRIKLDELGEEHSELSGEACLLAYDEQELTSTMLGDDIRAVFESRPGTAKIYIVAPFICTSEVTGRLLASTAFQRAGSYFHSVGGRLCVLNLINQNGDIVVNEIPYFVDEKGAVCQDQEIELHSETQQGWLFDLFDKFQGRVDAPQGVHFAKSSGRHSAKFLRVSNVLLSSSTCAIIAYFTLGSLSFFQPRRIFVDTASLLGVAFAIQRIAIAQSIWTLNAPISSFSSYGGLDQLPTPSERDLVIISASTSGGLVKNLVSKEFDIRLIVTLFFLGSDSSGLNPGSTVCNLTFQRGRFFGYPLIDSYLGQNCPLCKQGYFLAELEGDQFQLEKRAVRYLTVKVPSQTKDARDTLERLASKDIVSVRIYSQREHVSDFSINADLMLQSIDTIRTRFIRGLRRYTPAPLNYVILVDISEATVKAIISNATLDDLFEKAEFFQYQSLAECKAVPQGGALVIFGQLVSFATARDINAQLRIKVPKGCVAYISGITIANSAEHLADLKMFLTYGELGRETFTYDAACSIMLPARDNSLTAWDLELALLQRIIEDGSKDLDFENRISSLLYPGAKNFELFWPGKSGGLTIQNDFVYLDVSSKAGKISQADILATVANLLATTRMNYRGLTSKVEPGKEPVQWHQSVYGHVLLSPASFEDYNDAVLHAAFLRASSPAELNYGGNEKASGRVMSVIQATIQGWETGGGDSAPEFLVALATRRLTLTPDHTKSIKALASSSNLPSFMNILAELL